MSSQPNYNYKDKLCVSGLTQTTDINKLLQFFSLHGRNTFKITPDRQIVFIKFESPVNAKNAFKSHQNGIDIDGVKLTVEWARMPAIEKFDPKETMAKARKELSINEFQQASEKAWLSVDEGLKNLALQKRMSVQSLKALKAHNSKRQFAQFLDKYNSNISNIFAKAEQLHNNFYDGTMQHVDIDIRFDLIDNLHEILEKFAKDPEITVADWFEEQEKQKQKENHA